MLKFCLCTLSVAFLVALFIHPVVVPVVFFAAWWVYAR